MIHFEGLCLLAPSTGQLLGHFKVAQFPEGFHYRDSQTVTASKQAAIFGAKYQAGADARSERLRYINKYENSVIPKYKSEFKIGQDLGLKCQTPFKSQSFVVFVVVA